MFHSYDTNNCIYSNGLESELIVTSRSSVLGRKIPHRCQLEKYNQDNYDDNDKDNNNNNYYNNNNNYYYYYYYGNSCNCSIKPDDNNKMK